MHNPSSAILNTLLTHRDLQIFFSFRADMGLLLEFEMADLADLAVSHLEEQMEGPVAVSPMSPSSCT